MRYETGWWARHASTLQRTCSAVLYDTVPVLSRSASSKAISRSLRAACVQEVRRGDTASRPAGRGHAPLPLPLRHSRPGVVAGQAQLLSHTLGDVCLSQQLSLGDEERSRGREQSKRKGKKPLASRALTWRSRWLPMTVAALWPSGLVETPNSRSEASDGRQWGVRCACAIPLLRRQPPPACSLPRFLCPCDAPDGAAERLRPRACASCS